MFRWKIAFFFLWISALAANPSFVLDLENDPAALIEGRVNALTGRFSLYEEDLVIQGAEPIRISRTYVDDAQGDWRFTVDFAKILDTEKPYRWIIWEKDRCPILYKKVETVKRGGETFIRCEPSNLEKGFSNTSRGEISSRTNLKNQRALFDEKFKNLIVESADGTVRTYKKIQHSDREYQLVSERLPNGNWVLYDYKEIEMDSDRKQTLLASIRTTNSSQTKTFAKADFLYEDPKRKNKHFYVVGSDGQNVEYCFEANNGKQSGALQRVISSSGPDRFFEYPTYQNEYRKYGLKNGVEQRRLQTISLPLGRCFQVDYYKKEWEKIPWKEVRLDLDSWNQGFVDDPRRNRIKTISAPVSDSGLEAIYGLVYEYRTESPYILDRTTVYDAEGSWTHYHADFQCRIREIQRFSKEGKRLNAERYQWGLGDDSGCLISKIFLDGNLSPLFCNHYTYDKRGNVVEQKFCGNLSGSGPPISFDKYDRPNLEKVEAHVKKYRYTSTEPNLLLEEIHDTGLRIVYSYLPGTDLVASKLTYDKDRIALRQFYEYDEDQILIRAIEDDGSASDPNDLADVAVRTIRTIRPVASGPYFGLPETIEESYWENGKELPLKKTVLTYTTGARIAKEEIYDAKGHFRYVLETAYDEKGRPVERTNALGQKETIAYDLCGNPVKRRDFSGELTNWMDYDRMNRVVSAIQEGDIRLQTLFAYDKKHNLLCETDPRGHEILRCYDALGRCIETRLPETASLVGGLSFGVIRQDYDSAGNSVAKVDAEGNTTCFAFNAYGKPTLIIHPDGAKEVFSYYLNGGLKSHTNALGVATWHKYDFLGRLVRKTVFKNDAILAKETFAYKGRCLTTKTDPDGFKTRFFYDGAGRKIAEECEGETTFFAYDSLGRLSKTKKGDVCSLSEYDLLDRVIEEKVETTDGVLLRLVQYEYDEAGRQRTVIRSVGGESSLERKRYDSFGRLIEKTDPLGHRETTSYNDFFMNCFGQKVVQKTHTDPLGLQTIETFDARNQSVKTEKVKNSVLFTQEKIYDKNGRPIYQTDTAPSLQTSIFWQYDPCGRVKTLTESNAKTTCYEYTAEGKLAKMIKPNGTCLFYGYNELGFLISLSSSDGTVSHQMEYDRSGHLIAADGVLRKLDAQGRILEEKFPSSLSIQNTYDRSGRRIETAIPTADCLIAYSYRGPDLAAVERKNLSCHSHYIHRYCERDLSGNLLGEKPIGSFGHIRYLIDPLSRKTSITAPLFSQQILAFDPAGNILQMRVQNDPLSYTYDDLYQLTSEKNNTYAYDALQNRLKKNDEAYKTNNLNQIISHCEYDLNGNPTRIGDTQYTYDALGRLIRLEAPDLLQINTYDFLNRRLSQTTLFQNSQQVRYFLYDGQNEIGAFDEILNPVELRVLGISPHAEIGAAVAIELQKQIYAPIHDLQGNVAALLPLSGGRPTFYRYTAFGEERIDGEAPNPWRFSSKRTDDTGLVCYGRRFYHPSLGRWLTPDPAGFADGPNLYQFVHNDPLTHVDEYGLLAYHYKDGWQTTPWNSEFSWTTDSTLLPPTPPGQSEARFSIGCDPYRGRTPNYYVNGILNSRAYSRHGAAVLYKTFDSKANIVPFYSESFGTISDLFSVRKSIKDPNHTSFAIRRLHRELGFQTSSIDAMGDPRKIFVTGFSRGCADIFHAAKNLSPKQREGLIITACGPIMILPKELGFSVLNLISDGDWCSSHCSGGKKYLKHYNQFTEVQILPQKDGFSGLIRDHFFLSKTYQDGIRDSTYNKYLEFGELK